MADISKITIGSTTYDVKDAGAVRYRSQASAPYVSYNDLGSYYNAGSTATYIRVKLPTVTSWCMMTMEFTIRQSYSAGYAGKLFVYGNYSSGQEWNQFVGWSTGTLTSDIKVYGSGKQYIYIKGVASWGGLTLDKMTIGDSATSSDLSGIVIDGVSSLPSTYQTATMHYNEAYSVAWGNVTGKPSFAPVATSGSYNDLSNKPTIPTVNNSTITIKQTGISDQTFTLNGSATTITLVDTNTWRGIQDNLTSSTNTTESLSAKQGYLLANGSARDSTKVPTTRTVNGKALSSNITLTASDVGAVTTDTKNTVGNESTRTGTFYLVGVGSQDSSGGYGTSRTWDGRAFISGGTLFIEDLNVDGSGYFDGTVECNALTVGGNATISGTLAATGAITQNGTAVVLTNDSRMTNSRPASDVYSWAKASTKPSYTYSEVGAASSGHTHTTSIATTSDTNQITLAASTRYKLTAGGTSYVFTTPPSGGSGSLNLQLVSSYTGHSSSNSYSSISFNVTVSPSYLYYIVPMLHLYSDSSYNVGYYEVNAVMSLSTSGSPYDSWNTIIGAKSKVLAASYEDHHTDPQFNYTDGWLYMSDPFRDGNYHDTQLKGTVTISRKSPSDLELSRLWWTLNIYRICTFDAASFPMD